MIHIGLMPGASQDIANRVREHLEPATNTPNGRVLSAILLIALPTTPLAAQGRPNLSPGQSNSAAQHEGGGRLTQGLDSDLTPTALVQTIVGASVAVGRCPHRGERGCEHVSRWLRHRLRKRHCRNHRLHGRSAEPAGQHDDQLRRTAHVSLEALGDHLLPSALKVETSSTSAGSRRRSHASRCVPGKRAGLARSQPLPMVLQPSARKPSDLASGRPLLYRSNPWRLWQQARGGERGLPQCRSPFSSATTVPMTERPLNRAGPVTANPNKNSRTRFVMTGRNKHH